MLYSCFFPHSPFIFMKSISYFKCIEYIHNPFKLSVHDVQEKQENDRKRKKAIDLIFKIAFLVCFQ